MCIIHVFEFFFLKRPNGRARLLWRGIKCYFYDDYVLLSREYLVFLFLHVYSYTIK